MAAEAPKICAIVLAGGRGERFWPLSRAVRPKQMIALTGERTLLQQTLDRLHGLVPPKRTVVVTAEPLVDAVREQLPELPFGQVLGEPQGRNTAAAIALGALALEEYGPDAVLVALPADHGIGDPEAFRETLRNAATLAHDTWLPVTIGVRPTRPETGYGYIRCGERLGPAHRVTRFVEKPDRATAERFLTEGSYLWNSGIFVLAAATLWRLLAAHMPQLHDAMRTLRSASDSPAGDASVRGAALADAYATIDSVSFDHGVMERAADILVVPAAFEWDDLGAWPALERIGPKDGDGNVVRGRFVGVDTRDCIIHGDGRLIAAVGCEGLVVVDAGDAVLVCPKERAQDVRSLVESLRRHAGEAYL